MEVLQLFIEHRIKKINQTYDFLVDRNKKMNKKFKVTLPESPHELGQGTYGTAFDLGGGKVLKLTDDSAEAKSSSAIAGKKLKYINSIYNVFYVPSLDVYGIIQQKLKKPSWKVPKGLINMALDDIRSLIYYGAKKEDILDLFNDPTDETIPHYEDQQFMLDLNYDMSEKQFENLLNFVMNSQKELKSNGIKFGDYHTGNIMTDGKNLKVIDLGISSSGRKGKIDIIEKKEEIEEDLGVTDDSNYAWSPGPVKRKMRIKFKKGRTKEPYMNQVRKVLYPKNQKEAEQDKVKFNRINK